MLLLGVLFVQLSFPINAQEKISNTLAKNNVQRMEWQVNSVVREALVYIPESAKEKLTPIIFGFHGRGGTMQQSSDRYNFQNLWPEAIVVYPQGLIGDGWIMSGKENNPSARWQTNPGNNDNRDLKFFDVMLEYFNSNYKINDHGGVYLTGHSNGGGFVYLLWAERRDALAAIAPTSAQMSKYSPNAFLLNELTSIPVFTLAGKTDHLVLYEWWAEILPDILKLNKCNTVGTSVAQYLTVYKSETNSTTMTYIHPGGHSFPSGANSYIVDFFKNTYVYNTPN